MRLLARVMMAAGIACALCISGDAQAGKRVALVIGNSAYKYSGELVNPRNDATDISAAFLSLGFRIISGFDLDKPAMERKIREFATALQGAEAGVFFFAGHGLQVSGVNYLVPIDAQLSTATALDFEMIRLDLVHRTMEREAPTNIIFLDACRDNPLARNLARAMGTRSANIGRGLAPTETGVGTLISFSTQPGNVALDGEGRNSPYAGALIRQLGRSNNDLNTILIDVRREVRRETQGKQVPWEHSSLEGRFYFNAAVRPDQHTTPPPAAAPAPSGEAALAWNAVKDSTSVSALEAFIARFGGTFYAELARQRISELRARAKAAPAEVNKSAQPGSPSACKGALEADCRKLAGCAWIAPVARDGTPVRLGYCRLAPRLPE